MPRRRRRSVLLHLATVSTLNTVGRSSLASTTQHMLVHKLFGVGVQRLTVHSTRQALEMRKRPRVLCPIQHDAAHVPPWLAVVLSASFSPVECSAAASGALIVASSATSLLVHLRPRALHLQRQHRSARSNLAVGGARTDRKSTLAITRRRLRALKLFVTCVQGPTERPTAWTQRWTELASLNFTWTRATRTWSGSRAS
jgi:hypothetical protein